MFEFVASVASRNGNRYVGEMALLLLLSWIIVPFPDFPYDVEGFVLGGGGQEWYMEYLLSYQRVCYPSVFFFVEFSLLLFPMLLFRRVGSFLVAALLLYLIMLIGGNLGQWQVMVADGLRCPIAPDPPSLPLTLFCISLRRFLQWFLPFIAAVVVLRGDLRLRVFLPVYLIASCGVYFAFHARVLLDPPVPPGWDNGFPWDVVDMPGAPITFMLPIWWSAAGGIAAQTFLAWLCLRLPLHRAALERMITTARAEPRRSRAVPVALWFALAIPWVAFGELEWRLVKFFTSPPAPWFQGQTDAWPIVRDRFASAAWDEVEIHCSDDTEFHARLAGNELHVGFRSPIDYWLFCLPTDPETGRKAVARLDPAEIGKLNEALRPWTERMEQALEADYMATGELWHEYHPELEKELFWILIQEAAVRMHTGDPAGCLERIRILFHWGWLRHTFGSGYERYMGASFRGRAITACFNYYLLHRDDPPALRELRTLLLEHPSRKRPEFDPAWYRRTYPDVWPVIPYAEVTRGSLQGAWYQFHTKNVTYDQLLICLALEFYRHDQGEYPASLEALVPNYLESLPRDPFDGRAYYYYRTEDEFVVRSLAYEQLLECEIAWSRRSVDRDDLPMPPSSAVNQELLDRLDELDAADEDEPAEDEPAAEDEE